MRPISLFTASFFLASLLACAALDPECGAGTVEENGTCVPVTDADADTDTDADTDADSDADADATGPRVLEFTTTVAAITQGEGVRFNAVVTDPDGTTDLVGGSLLSAGGFTYGVFGGADGTYSLSVSWDEIDAVEPITFDDEELRVFTSRFYDVAGQEGEAEVTVRLHCGTGEVAREGECCRPRVYVDTGGSGGCD